MLLVSFSQIEMTLLPFSLKPSQSHICDMFLEFNDPQRCDVREDFNGPSLETVCKKLHFSTRACLTD